MADYLASIGNSASSVRLKDMGDGTVAEVVVSTTSAAPSSGDRLVDLGVSDAKIRLRDMGNGTHAVVIFGK